MADLEFAPLETFDEQAQRDLAKAGNVDFYMHEHALGMCSLFAVLDKGKRVGSILFCSESKAYNSAEKIFAVTAASTRSGRSLLLEGKDLISEYARRTGHSTVKFYTDRPKLAEAFLKMGARAKISWDV